MRNVLITGVSGYLGMRLAAALSRLSHIGQVVGIDIRPMACDENIRFYQMDIRDAQLNCRMAEHNIDTVFHLAFVVQPIRDLRRMHDIDCNGTRNVLTAARKAGVRQCIAVSSTLAYGAYPDNPELLSEDAPLRGNRNFPYAYYKALTDTMIRDFADAHPDMAITILRPCTVFGPHIDNYISRMLFLPVTVCVMGHDPAVQFVYEDDFVTACILSMESRASGAFNIAGDGTLKVSRIAQRLKTRLLPLPATVLYPAIEALWRMRCPGIEVNSGYLDYIRYPFVASNEKARQQMGFYPAYSTARTLDETVRRKTGA